MGHYYEMSTRKPGSPIRWVVGLDPSPLRERRAPQPPASCLLPSHCVSPCKPCYWHHSYFFICLPIKRHAPWEAWIIPPYSGPLTISPPGRTSNCLCTSCAFKLLCFCSFSSVYFNGPHSEPDTGVRSMTMSPLMVAATVQTGEPKSGNKKRFAQGRTVSWQQSRVYSRLRGGP